MGQLAKQAQDIKLAQAKPQKGLQEVIKSQWGKIEAVMPKHMSSERLFQLTISAINHEPKLMQADVATLLSCVMKCSALGLEPSAVDGLGRAYILPFRNKGKMTAQFILGYKGMIELAWLPA
jgi:recombination protein RecT